ncbi:TMEM175 family protein [Ligilactobacillus salivarius]|uniref:TMEM175 family protein n=1 Tax=Ligilactobacillus salivarius TaxID=1624 RepID=UPI0022E170E5|nr:TMEM175 family protein [Ligilactobacillus salivarius]
MRKFFLRRRNIKISEENIAEYHRRTEEMQKKRHSYLKQRLEALNDGIIAIIITIMVLEVPLPNGQNIASYYNFLGSLSVFLVSFFVVANFWYELGQSLALVDEIDKGIIIFDFVFLATLSLLPILTKWMMHNPSQLAVVNYGIVYMVANLLKTWLAHSQFRKVLGVKNNISEMMTKVIIGRFVLTAVFNLLLIVAAYFYPQITLYAYLALPIIDFFFPEDKAPQKKF